MAAVAPCGCVPKLGTLTAMAFGMLALTPLASSHRPREDAAEAPREERERGAMELDSDERARMSEFLNVSCCGTTSTMNQLHAHRTAGAEERWHQWQARRHRAAFARRAAELRRPAVAMHEGSCAPGAWGCRATALLSQVQGTLFYGLSRLRASTSATAAASGHSVEALLDRAGSRPPEMMHHKGRNYISQESCDSATDVLENLLAQEKWIEFVLLVGGVLTSLVALTSCSVLMGTWVKPRPPRYWSSRPWSPFTDRYDVEVDVTREYGEAVQRLLDITTRRDFMGLGRDGRWATHKAFRVLKVTRIERGAEWSHYARLRNAILPVKDSLKRMQKIWASYTQQSLTAIEAAYREKERDPLVKRFLSGLWLDASRNEWLLFHGSPNAGARDQHGNVLYPSEEISPAYAIKRSGFDDRLASVKGMYGAGTYFGDHASKADQYAGMYHPAGTGGSVGEVATMFLARVVMGTPYVTDQSLEYLRRPPCIHGEFDLNLFWNTEVAMGRPWQDKGVRFQICDHPRFDSVIAGLDVDGKTRLYREYVVYDKQCYPEFCVTYQRTM